MLSTTSDATLLHWVTGEIDLPAAKQGAAAARQVVQQLGLTHPGLNLLLDLRGMCFLTLQAHQAWKRGFTHHPLVIPHIRYTAIIGDATPNFRAEQAQLTSAQCHFFLDRAAGEAWLDTRKAQEKKNHG